VKTEQNESEIEKGRHLRLRRVVAELREGSATAFGLGTGGFIGGGELEHGRTEEGQREGCGSAL